MAPGHRRQCMNSSYPDVLPAQIKEICENYDDGIFLDITGMKVCYCHNCIKSMTAEGLNPYNEDDARSFAAFSKRGENIDVIENSVPLYNTKVCIRCDRHINEVYTAPDNMQIPFKQKDGKVSFAVEKFENWCVVVLE